MTTGCRGTGDDRKSDTNSKAPSDLEDAAEGCGTGLGRINVEGSDSCYAGEAGVLSVSWPLVQVAESTYT